MKTKSKFLTTFLFIAACCASLGFNINVVRADDGELGGEIEGTENLDVEVTMTPTAAAPSGSSIRLSLEAEDDNGTTDAKLKLETQSLPAGTYSIGVTLKSDGSTVALGTFSVDAEGEAEIEFATNPEDDEGPLPAGFNPLDIATVSVADLNNVVLFTADLTNSSAATSSTILTANITGRPGPTDPSAVGSALLSAVGSRSGTKGSVQLSGHGLAPNTVLTILANRSTMSKKVTTDQTGSFNVKIGPQGRTSTVAPGVTLLQITSITLQNKFGSVLLSFSF